MESGDYSRLIASVEDQILSGEKMRRSDAETLLETPDEHLLRLMAAADRIRLTFKGRFFDSCSLINARSGLCGEDCAFCAQSKRHASERDTYGLVSGDEILAAARAASGRMGAAALQSR